MAELRQFLRYEIPGFLYILYIFLFSMCFLESEIQKLLLLYVHIMIIPIFIIAMPLGWIIYQIYDTYSSGHISDDILNEIELLAIKEGIHLDGTVPNKTYFGQAMNIGLYSQNKELKCNEALISENLRMKYDYYHARNLNSITILLYSFFTSLILLIIIHLLPYISKVEDSIIVINGMRLIILFIVFILILTISSIIYFRTKKIKNEIYALEKIVMKLHEKEIIIALKSISISTIQRPNR